MEFVESKSLPKTSGYQRLKLQYLQEIEAIKSRYGDIDGIRKRLNLSQRGFCKLLMVDPSTYNRWKESPTGPPAYIWRSVSWYLLITEKDPWLATYFSKSSKELETKISRNHEIIEGDLQALKNQLIDLSIENRKLKRSSEEEKKRLQKKLSYHTRYLYFSTASSLVMLGLVVGLLL